MTAAAAVPTTETASMAKSILRVRLSRPFMIFVFLSSPIFAGYFVSLRPSSALSRLSRPAKYLGILQGANYCYEARKTE